jgi:hypothetical protein
LASRACAAFSTFGLGARHHADAVIIGHDHVARLTSALAQTTGTLTLPSVFLTVPCA